MTKLSILLAVAVLACAAAPAAAHARATQCRTSSCKAIIIHELTDIEDYEDDHDIEGPHGAVLLMPGNRPKIADRRLHRSLLDHPERYGPVCTMAVKLVSRVRPGGEIFIPVTLLVHGVDMDLRDQGHCARDLVTALPRDPANDLIRINARDLCVSGDEKHERLKAACAVLVEGVTEKQ